MQNQEHENDVSAPAAAENSAQPLTAEGGDKAGPSDVERIQRCEELLIHVSSCQASRCDFTSCVQMKRVVAHGERCRQRNDPVCQKLMALCCYHARRCTTAACRVPFCMNIRARLNAQK